MRDIRGELQERACLFEAQVNAHEAEFEKHIERLSASMIQTRGPQGRARGGDEADGD
jgi:hypothetical protein